MNYITSQVVFSGVSGNTLVYYTVNNKSDKEVKYMVLSRMESKTRYNHSSFTVPARSMYVSSGYVLPSSVFVIEEGGEGEAD